MPLWGNIKRELKKTGRVIRLWSSLTPSEEKSKRRFYSIKKVHQSQREVFKPVCCQRSPGSPRGGSVFVSLLYHHWLGAGRGRYGFGTNIVIDFKVQELEPMVSYAPFSWRYMRCIPVATPIFASLSCCQEPASCGILAVREKQAPIFLRKPLFHFL